MYLHPLLADLAPKDRLAWIQDSQLRSYRRNEKVLEVGGSTDVIPFVNSGLLRVVVEGSVGEEVTTDFIGSGGFYSESVMNMGDYCPLHSVIATLPSSVYLIPISAMHTLLQKSPKSAILLLAEAIKRMNLVRTHFRQISSLTSSQRVWYGLCQLLSYAPTGEGGYDKRITQRVIASYLGLSRGVVNEGKATVRDRRRSAAGRVKQQSFQCHPPLHCAAVYQ
ncbi:Crp/Fnr family transcriptional regulator, partial [Pseudomonas aeruginosa]|uniref:Crp/Fnr family transcriptional regulator n=1 Tax=Pseudomonas aeruginosa TaxID=287 RepID=UPI0011D0F07C